MLLRDIASVTYWTPFEVIYLINSQNKHGTKTKAESKKHLRKIIVPHMCSRIGRIIMRMKMLRNPINLFSLFPSFLHTILDILLAMLIPCQKLTTL